MKTISAFCIWLLAFNVCSDEINLQDLDVALQNLLDDDQRAFYGIPANIPVPKPYPKRKHLSTQANFSLSKTHFLFSKGLNKDGKQEALKTKLQYPKLFSIATTPIGPSWLFVKNITLIPLKINYISSGDSAIPDSIFRTKIQGYNCTGQEQAIKSKIFNSYKVSRNSVVNSNIKSDSKFSLGFPIGNTGATIGFDKTFNVGIGENVTTNEEHVATDEDEINQLVPPHTKRMYYLERIVKTGYYYFNGTVLADGDLSPNPSPESSVPFVGLLSQALIKPEFKDPLKRTFHVSGYTWNASGFDKNYYWIDDPISANQCSSLIKTHGSTYGVLPDQDEQSQEVISPLFNSMMVETSNVSGAIFVRAKSNASISCDISFSTLTDHVTVKAPPKKWSDWIELTTHNGRASYSVDYSIMDNKNCSTSIEPQIKYMQRTHLQDLNNI